MRLEDCALGWLLRRREERMLKAYGGIQRCPWCRQWAQGDGGWNFRPWADNPLHDELTCGVCGDTSLWHFGLGMHAIRPLSPPEPAPDFPNEIEAAAAMNAAANASPISAEGAEYSGTKG